MNFQSRHQHTFLRDVWGSGVGLHSGLKVSMRLRPAPPGYGVRFRRMDVPEARTISADYHHVVNTFQATTIGFDGVVVSTIEHLMAALYGIGIDNALVEVDGPEVPIFDGSAAPYLRLMERAGLREQPVAKEYLIVRRPITVSDGDSYIKAVPCNRLRVRYLIDYSHPLVGKQERSWTFESGTFGTEIAHARTFGFLKDVRKLHNMGLIQGGSLANAVVFGDEGLLNEDGFRYDDECVRHKILDFIGDLALTGMSVLGTFEVRKAGHSLHSRFLHQLMARHACAAPKPAPVSAVNMIHAASALASCLGPQNKSI